MNQILLKLQSKLQAWVQHEDGQDLTEYALVVSLISAIAVAGMTQIGTTLSTMFSKIASDLS